MNLNDIREITAARLLHIPLTAWTCKFEFDDICLEVEDNETYASFSGIAELVANPGRVNGFHVGALCIETRRPWRPGQFGPGATEMINLPIMADGVHPKTNLEHLGAMLAETIERHPKAEEFFQAARAE